MPDVSEYTDKELFKIAGVEPPVKTQTLDLSSISNEELFSVAGIEPPETPPEAIIPETEGIQPDIAQEPVISEDRQAEPPLEPEDKPSLLAETIMRTPQFTDLEATAAIGTGLAAFPIAGVAGLVKAGIEGVTGAGKDEAFRKAGETIENFMQKFTYQPRTEEGAKRAQTLMYPIEIIDKVATYAGDKVQDVTGSPLANAITKTAVFMAIPILGQKGGKLAFAKVKNSPTWRMATIKERGLMARDLVERIEEMKARGMSEGEIARIDPEAFKRMFDIRKAGEVTPDVIRTKTKGAVKDMLETRVEEGVRQGLPDDVAVEGAIQEVNRTSAGKTQIQTIKEEAQKTVDKLRSEDISKSLKEEEVATKAIEKEQAEQTKAIEKQQAEATKQAEKVEADKVKTEAQATTVKLEVEIKALKEKLAEKEVKKPEPTPITPVHVPETGESAEAISRVKADKRMGREMKMVDTRTGKERPLIGVDAVDIKPQPFEAKIYKYAEGKREIIDKGSKARALPEIAEPKTELVDRVSERGIIKGDEISRAKRDADISLAEVPETKISELSPTERADILRQDLTPQKVKDSFTKTYLNRPDREVITRWKDAEGNTNRTIATFEYLPQYIKDASRKGIKFIGYEENQTQAGLGKAPTLSFMGTGEIEKFLKDAADPIKDLIRGVKNEYHSLTTRTYIPEDQYQEFVEGKRRTMEVITYSIFEKYTPTFRQWNKAMRRIVGKVWSRFRNIAKEIYRKVKREATRIIREKTGGIETPEFLRRKTERVNKAIKKSNEAERTKPPTPTDLKTTWEGGLILPEETTFQAFRRSIEDFNVRLKILNKGIEDVAGEQLSEHLDLWMQKDILPREQSDMVKQISHEKRDFAKDMMANNVTVEEIKKLTHALHAKERNAKMNELRVEKNKEPIDGLSGMTDKVAETILNKAKPKQLRLAQKIINGYKEILDFEVAQGLTRQSEADIYKKTYKNYVALYRDVEGADFTGIGQGISITGKESKRAVGSTREVINPASNYFYRKERAQIRALKNEVGKTVINLTKQYPFLEDIFKVEKQKYLPRFNKEGELEYLDPRFKFGDNVIGAKIDGNQYFITISDRKIASALKNLNLARVSRAVQALRSVLSIWAGFKTRWRPEFLITNFERDLGEALINLGVEASKLKDAGKGLRREVVKGLTPSYKELWNHLKGKGQNPQVEEFFKLGGDTGHFWTEDILKAQKSLEQLEKELTNKGIEKIKNPIRKAGEFVDRLQTTVELGVRYSAYKALTRRGMSKKRAIQSAADMTINFSRQGEMSPFLKSFYGFINPAIQGSSKVIRTISTKHGQSRVMGAIGGLAALGFLIRTLSIMLDEEGDEQIADWAKTHKLTLAVGGGKQITLWSMPYGYAVFYGLGSNIAELMFKKKTIGEALSSELNVAIDSFSPFDTSLNSLIPTLAKPIYEINTNTGWYDGPIYLDQIFTRTPKPDFETYFDNTSKTAIFSMKVLNKATGGLVDIHPNSLEYLYNQWFGGPFEFVTSSIEAGAKGMKGEFDQNKTPFVRQFYRQGKPQQFSYKVIYDTLEKAFKQDITGMEKDRFYRAVDIGRREKIFDEKRESGFIQDFIRAQAKITGRITDNENIDKLRQLSSEDRKRLINSYSERTRRIVRRKLNRR